MGFYPDCTDIINTAVLFSSVLMCNLKGRVVILGTIKANSGRGSRKKTTLGWVLLIQNGGAKYVCDFIMILVRVIFFSDAKE